MNGVRRVGGITLALLLAGPSDKYTITGGVR